MRKHRGKQRITSIRNGVAPTKERLLQNGGVVTEVVERDDRSKVLVKRYRAVWECPLDAYRDAGMISEAEYRAGLRFREAYQSAVLSAHAARERLNRYPATTGLTLSERLLKEARAAVSPHNMGTIIDICGHDRVLGGTQALEKLRGGLGPLAILWNMAAQEVCGYRKE